MNKVIVGLTTDSEKVKKVLEWVQGSGLRGYGFVKAQTTFNSVTTITMVADGFLGDPHKGEVDRLRMQFQRVLQDNEIPFEEVIFK